MEHPKYINPFTDFGFKKIFGDEKNKDLLIDFLNELLAYQNEKIATLTYKPNDKLGQTGIDRNVVFDLFCENEKGEKFNVELQKAKQHFFKDRMVYYSSFSIQEQGVKGKKENETGDLKDWNYQLKAVYVIGILDFIIDEEAKDKIVVSHNKIMDIHRKTVFYDKLTFITIQMPNFTKTADKLETNFDKWLYVLKNLNRLNEIPKELQEETFKKVFQVAEYAAMTKEERKSYENSVKYYRDLHNVIDTAEEKGLQEGLQKGKEEAENKLFPIIEQKEQVIEQKEQVIEQKNQVIEQNKQALLNSAKAMLKAGMDLQQVQTLTGLTKDEINRIQS